MSPSRQRNVSSGSWHGAQRERRAERGSGHAFTTTHRPCVLLHRRSQLPPLIIAIYRCRCIVVQWLFGSGVLRPQATSKPDPIYCAIAAYRGSWDRPDATFADAVRATVEQRNAPNFDMPKDAYFDPNDLASEALTRNRVRLVLQVRSRQQARYQPTICLCRDHPSRGHDGSFDHPSRNGAHSRTPRFCSSGDVLSGFVAFAGNNALNQPRSRPSDVIAGAVRAA